MATTQGQGIGAFSPYITQAGAYSGPSGYQSFMSPYQQDVIDATLAEYDQQAGAGLTGIGQQAAMSGNLGGGREGVMRAQYKNCLLYTSPSPRDGLLSRMPSSA